MTTLQDLLERVEKAEGPDREIDVALWLHTTPGATRRGTHVKHAHSDAEWDVDETRDATGYLVVVPAYTASLDAALALVERKLPGWTWRLDSPDSASEPAFARLSGPEWRSGAGWAKTPALALLAALLRALIAQGEAEQKAG